MKTELWLSGNESRTSESILNLQETFIIDDQLANDSQLRSLLIAIKAISNDQHPMSSRCIIL